MSTITPEERYVLEVAVARTYGCVRPPRGLSDVSGVPNVLTRAVEGLLDARRTENDAQLERILARIADYETAVESDGSTSYAPIRAIAADLRNAQMDFFTVHGPGQVPR